MVWVLSVVIGEPRVRGGVDRAVTPALSHLRECEGLSGILSISGLVMGVSMMVSMIEGVRLMVCECG